MNEKTVPGIGGEVYVPYECIIAVGIITLVTGVTAGVLMIVSGSRLLKRKSDILI